MVCETRSAALPDVEASDGHLDSETPTGQSRSAYRLAAIGLLLNVVISVVGALFTSTNFDGTVFIRGSIDVVLAIGLLKLWAGARRWVLIRSILGAILGPLIILVQTTGSLDGPSLVCVSLVQWGFCGALILLLTGRSSSKRLGLAMGLFAAVFLVSVLPLIPLAVSRINPPHLVIETASPAIGTDGTLSQDVGIVAQGGMFLPLLDHGSITPCSVGFVYSTEVDNQEYLFLSIFRGRAEIAASVYQVGTFRIEGISPAPRGESQVEIILSALEEDLVLLAFDKKTGKKLRIVEVTGPQF